MRTFFEIPVLGYILRWCNSLLKLPKKLETLFEKMQIIENEMVEIERREEENRNFHIENLQKQIKELENDNIELQHRCTNLLQKQILEIDTIRENIKSIQQQIQEHFEILKGHQETLDQSVKDIVALRKNVIEKIQGDSGLLESLNRELSIHKTLWGEEERLHISSLAAVSSCFFNTNSGQITIGDYTFAGSGVSVLAGSHDMLLSGLMRREYSLTEKCDIEIGQGVWLASNSTILGPCKIGNNAVIAAGAVVVPGTVVPENAIYAGIPAREIKRIECDNSLQGEPFQKALKRAQGVVFYDGWTEHQNMMLYDQTVSGHWLVQNTGKVYILSKECEVYGYVESCNDQHVTIKSNGEILREIREEKEIIVLKFEQEFNEVIIEKSQEKGRVFIAVKN